ncbi:MAG: hypothetical protein JRF50_13075 [Deltaproteobacteria bacterium]|nr:hypothetical protein [Deltaproteobacteria bacterium]
MVDSEFPNEERGIGPGERGVEEAKEATSTAQIKHGKADVNPAGIKLRCEPYDESVYYGPVYTEQISPYLARDPNTGLYFTHGNWIIFLEKKKQGKIFERVTFTTQHKYGVRQLRREFHEGKIDQSRFVTKEKTKFRLDIDVDDYEPAPIERELNSWVDAFGPAPLGVYGVPSFEWKPDIYLQEWIWEVKEHMSFGRLFFKAILERRPSEFRIRQYAALELSPSKWDYLVDKSADPYDRSVRGPSLDTGWMKAP